MSRKIVWGALVAVIVLITGAFALRGENPCEEHEAEKSGYEADRALRCEGHPEVDSELAQINAQAGSIAAAPGHEAPPADLYGRAARAARKMAKARRAKENTKPWKPYGSGPLRNADKDYTGVNGLGLVNIAGRVTDFAYDKAHNQLYASFANGGVWRSDDQGGHWVSVGDRLPTQVIGSVGYSPADGGTLIVVSGDGSFGRTSSAGAGAYRSNDGGRTWTHARGVPDGALGFKVAVDPANPSTVYLATGAGLYRSTDAGRTYADVKLPVGPCAGKGNAGKCALANIVTDVAVQAPGGSSNVKGGKVLTVVGWRGGTRANPDGSVQSPGNGLYASDTGAPGSFTAVSAPGFAPKDRIGRTEFGPAVGADQDHNYIYATVQDAVLDRDGTPSIDLPAPEDVTTKIPTEFNGVYVSSDFGQTWREVEDSTALQNPTTGSSLAVVFQATGAYGPGVQSWYDQFIAPDPTRQVGGVPSRVVFGLEEVWRNDATALPVAGPASFRVIGRYFSGRTCLGLEQSPCPTNGEDAASETTTTHPDQHAAIFIPQADGGVRLIVGNDGGVFAQTAAPGGELNNSSWGDGAQGDGAQTLQTLLPYDVALAKDGTAWMGLQDNGTVKIADTAEQPKRVIATLGGDGFFVGVDPDNANVAYGEYVEGSLKATKDGGKTWTEMSPPITNAQFSNPFALDPHDPDHLLTAGNEVVETGSGAGTGADEWAKVYDLGTAKHPGDPKAEESGDDALNSMSAIAMDGVNAYVGFCGVCGILNDKRPFKNGLATNVGGAQKPERYTSKGWHIATAAGLPNRYITSIAIDPKNARTIWVTLGGYRTPWIGPSFTGGNPSDAAGGHLYVSRDAGEHFTDMSKNLPDVVTNWVTLRKHRPIVATDVGVFALTPKVVVVRKRHGRKKKRHITRFEVLGKGLPAVKVSTVHLAPNDSNLLIAATYGRGAWTYRFGKPGAPTTTRPPSGPPAAPFGGQDVGAYDFETDEQGWTVTTNSSTMQWTRRPPGDASAQSFQVVPYTDDASTALVSPAVDIPQASTIKLSWTDARDTEPCCDFMSVDWTVDGHVWHPAKAFAGQNPDFPQFTGESVEFAVPAGKLQVRFRLTADSLISSPAYTGVRIDNVKIQR